LEAPEGRAKGRLEKITESGNRAIIREIPMCRGEDQADLLQEWRIKRREKKKVKRGILFMFYEREKKRIWGAEWSSSRGLERWKTGDRAGRAQRDVSK